MPPISRTDPIFIVGTERSGSNLLRVILDAHPRLDVPHPPHIMKYFAGLEAGYGDLREPDRRRALARDIGRLLAVHIHPWELPVDLDAAAARADPPDLFGIFVQIYEQHRAAAGKARWGCKSTFMIHHAERVLEHFPGARFIWLVRDARDVAASSRRSVFSPYHPYLSARLWAEQQRLGLALEAAHPGATLRLRYEDLLAEPEGALRGVCGFIGEDYAPEMLRFFETRAARVGAGLSVDWGNTARPILRGNTRKYRKELSDGEVWMVEAAAGAELIALGYELEYPEPGHLEPGPGRLLGMRVRDELWHLQVEWRSLRTDRNHWRRWGRGVTMALIRARGRLR